MAEPAQPPAPLPGPVTIGEFRARLAEMTDRVLAGEEVIVLRGSQPVARFVPVEPRPPKRLGTLREFLSEGERREVREAMERPLSNAERRIVAGEGTDDLGIWKGSVEKRDGGDGT